MDWVPVKSSAMRKIAWQDGEIFVDWNGKIYAYEASMEIFQRFLSAASKGIFANTVVKQFPTRKIIRNT